MVHTTEAIVLKSLTFRESDQLVTFLTPDLGKVTGLARYGKKSQKRFGPVFQPFNILDIRYRSRAPSTLLLLEKATVHFPLMRIPQNFNQIVSACYCVELMDEMVKERDPNQDKYWLLLNVLMQINEGVLALASLLRWYEYRLLSLAGLAPQFEYCVKCHQPLPEEGECLFVYWEGGIVCASCGSSGKMSELVPVQMIREFLLFVETMSEGKRVELTKEAARSFRHIFHNFIHYHLNKVLKSQAFMASVRHSAVSRPSFG
jgi:DNA repair protein RecO (recombination protein O)